MLQRESYILSEYNRLTGRHLEPLTKRCSQDRWRSPAHYVYYGASYCCSVLLSGGTTVLFTFMPSFLTKRKGHGLTRWGNGTLITWQYPFSNIKFKVCALSLEYFIKICFRKSHLCMKGRKSCSFLLHKYIIPSLHCIRDRMFRRAQRFRNGNPRRT